jgi:hypothetical protein
MLINFYSRIVQRDKVYSLVEKFFSRKNRANGVEAGVYGPSIGSSKHVLIRFNRSTEV